MTVVQLGPDLDTIKAIHRGADSYVRFSRMEPSGAMVTVASLQVSRLEEMFPSIRDELVRDSYFTVNSFWRPGTAKTEDLRYLNVAYADLDYYKARTRRSEAIRAIVDAQDAGVLPPASILADSGRGFWALWLLKSPNEPEVPERFYRQYPKRFARYRRVQMALHRVLKKLEPGLVPDPLALDASRIAPVPGTIKSKSGHRVKYWIQAGPGGEGFTYTLSELEDFFGIRGDCQATPDQLLTWGGEKRIAANVSGYRALHAARIVDLEALWIHRKGFKEGHRNIAALVYAGHLRGIVNDEGKLLSEGEISDRIHELAADCNPPLSDGEVANVLKSSRKRYKWPPSVPM